MTLRVEDCINEACPWSGKPVDPGSLALYRGHVVGFCNTGCRDKFQTATSAFDTVLAARNGTPDTQEN